MHVSRTVYRIFFVDRSEDMSVKQVESWTVWVLVSVNSFRRLIDFIRNSSLGWISVEYVSGKNYTPSGNRCDIMISPPSHVPEDKIVGSLWRCSQFDWFARCAGTCSESLGGLSFPVHSGTAEIATLADQAACGVNGCIMHPAAIDFRL